jgi:hypothetical protein
MFSKISIGMTKFWDVIHLIIHYKNLTILVDFYYFFNVNLRFQWISGMILVNYFFIIHLKPISFKIFFIN